MGWGDCGKDSNGRPIGYVFDATCDHPDCMEQIDRGLTYVCGDMHGDDEYSCEKYFCDTHKNNYVTRNDGSDITVCNECWDRMIEDGELYYDEEEETLSHLTCAVVDMDRVNCPEPAKHLIPKTNDYLCDGCYEEYKKGAYR